MDAFKLTNEQYAQYNNWMTNHNKTCKYYSNSGEIASVIGGRITFCFTQNSLGMEVEIKCKCGASIDLTDVSEW